METEPLLPRLDRTDSQERAYASELRQIAECDLNAKLVSSLFVDSLPGTCYAVFIHWPRGKGDS